MDTTVSRFLTIDEVAERLRVSKSFLYKRTMSRDIPHYRIGKRCLFDAGEIDKWILENSRIDTK